MKFSEMITCISSINGVSEETKKGILSYINAQKDLLELKEIDEDGLTELIASITITEKTIEEIRVLIYTWINENFDQDRQAQQLHRNASSLTELLQAQDSGWKRAWGCDSDFRRVVPLLFEKIKGDTTYIACPSKTLIASNDIELNGESFKDFIKLNLEKSLEKFVLLIPLNDNQRHWLLGAIRVENGKLKKGTLWNSTSTINEVVFIQFELILKSIDDSVTVMKTNKKNQIDGFRCFDYVCQEILNYVGTAEDQGIISAKTGYELRDAIGEKIAKSLERQFPQIDPVTPLIEKLNNLTINDPEVKSAFEALRAALLKHSPKLVDEFDRTGILIIDSKENNLTFSCSTNKSKSERPDALKPDFLNSRNLDMEFKEIEKEKRAHQANFSQEEIKKLEESFYMNYDDSSDSEGEDEIKNPEIDLRKFRSYVPKGNTSLTNDASLRISFYLHVFGVMLMRASFIDRIYRQYKHSIELNVGDKSYIKSTLFSSIKEHFSEIFNENDYEKYIWPLFLKKFREFSKKNECKSLEKIADNSITSVILTSLNKEKIDDELTQNKINSIVNNVFYTDNGREKIIRNSNFSREINVIKENNISYQMIAITRFIYRLTRRNFKIKENSTPNQNFTVNFIEFNYELTRRERKQNPKKGERKTIDSLEKHKEVLNVSEQISLTINDITQKRSDWARLNGLQSTNYPSLLLKFTDYIRDYSLDKQINLSDEFSKIISGIFKNIDSTNKFIAAFENNKDKERYIKYVNFLIQFYYLLQRVESGRNPGSLIINIILFTLKSENKINWYHVLPSRDEQQQRDCTNYIGVYFSQNKVKDSFIKDNYIYLTYSIDNLKLVASWRSGNQLLENEFLLNEVVSITNYFNNGAIWIQHEGGFFCEDRTLIDVIVLKYGCAPLYMHPMTYKGAEQASADLVREFNKLAPELNFHPLTIDQTKNNSDVTDKIKSKQFSIVDFWLKEKKIDMSTLENDEKIIENLCELVNFYYFPARP